MAKQSKEPVAWFTVNGKHIPIFDGESRDGAYTRAIVDYNEGVKEKQIAKRKEEADMLNTKKTDVLENMKAKVDKYTEDELNKNIIEQKNFLSRVNDKIRNEKNPEDKDYLYELYARHNKILDYMKSKRPTLFKVDWKKMPGNTTANKIVTDYFKKNKIDYFNTKYGDLVGDVDHSGDYYKIDHMGDGRFVVDRSEKFKKPKK